MRTNVYIDGFNLYYGALKGKSYKWLDPRRLAAELLPRHEIGKVCYCTARLEDERGNSGPRRRQNIYLRALRTLPNLEIVFGTFRKRTKRRPLVEQIEGLPSIVTIAEWEEKKTDVNLTTEMIFDGFKRDYDQALVISNDTDLVRPIGRVRDELDIPVVVANPFPVIRTPREIYRAASRVVRVRDSHLSASQLPDEMLDSQGRKIRKPARW